MTIRKTQLAAAVGAALLALAGAAQAQQTQPLKVEVGGQVTRALMYADDGVQKKTFNVDNEVSGTRFRFAGSAGMTPGIRAGVLMEFDFQSNESSVVTMAAPSSAPSLVERHMDVWFEHMSFGKFHLGQGDGAANGAVEVDLSGTGIITSSSAVQDIGAALAFRTSAGALSTATITNTIDRYDFESRYDRAMYVTPVFSGFRGQVSNGVKDGLTTTEAALWYAGKLGAFGDLAGAFGYSQQGNATPGAAKDEYMGGSISWLHGSGINLTFGHTEREIALTGVDLGSSRSGSFDYFKVGYKFGQHAIAADYALGKDQNAAGDESKMMGIGYVFTPISWAELYAGYKVHSLDRAGATFEDIALFTVGTRLKF
jgi:hypothetical protein